MFNGKHLKPMVASDVSPRVIESIYYKLLSLLFSGPLFALVGRQT